tara:strand:+ start:623 stop:1261 length:639 start_codon:yes stop_codon:yes gene_type:complete
MAGSYESEQRAKLLNGEESPENVNIATLKYFWLSNPRLSSGKNIPKFLRAIPVLSTFTDNELRILSKHMHHRSFGDGEVIFKQNDVGFGFYLIYGGHVDILVNNRDEESTDSTSEQDVTRLLTLEAGEYFGELSLLQEHSVRNASAISRQGCELLGLFKPDIDQLIIHYPVIAAKLLQSVSQIIANRFYSLSREVRELKFKLAQIEKEKAAT